MLKIQINDICGSKMTQYTEYTIFVRNLACSPMISIVHVSVSFSCLLQTVTVITGYLSRLPTRFSYNSENTVNISIGAAFWCREYRTVKLIDCIDCSILIITYQTSAIIRKTTAGGPSWARPAPCRKEVLPASGEESPVYSTWYKGLRAMQAGIL